MLHYLFSHSLFLSFSIFSTEVQETSKELKCPRIIQDIIDIIKVIKCNMFNFTV